MKKLRVIPLVVMLAFLCSCSVLANDDRLVIWSFTDEAVYAVDKFKEQYPDIDIRYVQIPGSQYESKARAVLQTGVNAPDVFLIEKSVLPKLIDLKQLENLSNAPYNAEEITNEQYDYVAAASKDADGNVKALGYQGTPGGIYYRRDLTEKYLGTQDPVEITKMMADWESVMEVSESIYEKSEGEVYGFTNWNNLNTIQIGNVKKPWVKDGKLVIDPARLEILDLIDEAHARNVVKRIRNGSPAGTAAMQNGTVAFFPGATWGLQYTFKNNAPDTEGKWGLASPPHAFSAGGTFLAMYSGSEKKENAWKFIKFYAGDDQFLKQLATDQEYFVSNREVNAYMAEKTNATGSPFLAGQNYFEFFANEGDRVYPLEETKYDSTISPIFTDTVQLYVDGSIQTHEDVVKRFKRDVKLYYPDLDVEGAGE
ncbi:ABC transporter substrate-binding protein [Aureibacillus halotolerans]|uniref:ABC-type glycerol-3-phosphate transport system substrate-binding protein n=1 Tax=Aureibacillus halotolerans TaxID=1508390 RepID=A0A4R6U3E0_9BACI|nr:extracellular solute-binding protein [Aureibacillus halotolerans]TDQ40910.1 ABC-type glycerol-3-phosphate transport system substrate-binding protein [Aureibacillus halotolerans]